MAIAGRVAIVPKGDWSADATYKRLDAVTYNNTLYFAKKEVPAGTATSNTEYWSKSIVGGASAIATTEDAGVVKPADGLTVAEDGTLKVNIDGTTLTMDQVNNVIKLADTLKEKINGAFPAANLINNLTTTEAGFGLDARQGKALDDKITEINGSFNKRLIGNRFFTTDTTTITDIKNFIFENLDTGITYMNVYDEKGKFFGSGGNWFIAALAQDNVSAFLLAINHWEGGFKILGTYKDSSDKMMLKIFDISTTYSKDI